MSETAAPAAPAAPVAATESAPAPAQAETKAPPPADPLAELDTHIAKAGLKYKSGGKERSVASIKELLRKAEVADGLQAKADSLLERERQASAVLERDAKLKAAKSAKERVAILREYAGEAFDEAAEEAILERIEREKSMQNLSPDARAAKEEAERMRSELEALRAQQMERERLEQETAEKQAQEQLAAELAGHVVKALTAAKLPKGAAADAGRRLAVLLERSESLGLPLTAEDLSGKAVEWAGRDFRAYTTGLEGEALLSWMGDDVARRVSSALLARHYGGQATASMPAPQPKPAQPEAKESPMAMWKRLGAR